MRVEYEDGTTVVPAAGGQDHKTATMELVGTIGKIDTLGRGTAQEMPELVGSIQELTDLMLGQLTITLNLMILVAG